jgi:hypothetical protein
MITHSHHAIMIMIMMIMMKCFAIPPADGKSTPGTVTSWFFHL